MTKTLTIAALLAVSIGLSGCDSKTAAPTAVASKAPGGAKSGKATGTVTAIDAAAGTITLDHGAIPAVGWPAMTMGFSAKPDLLAGITVGDKVDFDVTVNGNGGQVTAITKK